MLPLGGLFVTAVHREGSLQGADLFLMEDVVENRGFVPVEHMLLYHFNIGFPFVDDGAELTARIVEHRPDLAARLAGVTEETTTGVARLRALDADVHFFNVESEGELRARVSESAGQDASWQAFHVVEDQAQALDNTIGKVVSSRTPRPS